VSFQPSEPGATERRQSARIVLPTETRLSFLVSGASCVVRSLLCNEIRRHLRWYHPTPVSGGPSGRRPRAAGRGQGLGGQGTMRSPGALLRGLELAPAGAP